MREGLQPFSDVMARFRANLAQPIPDAAGENSSHRPAASGRAPEVVPIPRDVSGAHQSPERP